jgi:multicomponent Na+:H+ antiporter subunit G
MRQAIIDVLLLLGVAIMTIALVGLVRLPNLMLRLHAASKAASLGVIPLALATAIAGGTGDITGALLVALVVIVTAPVAAHVLAQVAHHSEEVRTPDPDRAPGPERS